MLLIYRWLLIFRLCYNNISIGLQCRGRWCAGRGAVMDDWLEYFRTIGAKK